VGRKGTKVLKEGETEWNADRSAALDCESWKDLCKPSASAGGRGSTNLRKYLSAPPEPIAYSLH